MIRRVDYECTVCGARARVSGGPSSSAREHTITIGCWTCGQLDDIVIAVMGETSIHDDDSMPPCRAGGSDATAPWVEGNPCPKCGAPVRPGEMETLVHD